MKLIQQLTRKCIGYKRLAIVDGTHSGKSTTMGVGIIGDSDYAGNPNSRRSVSGFVLYVCGIPISWRSKAQHSVALSSSDAEWVAASGVVKEVMFVLQLLQSMKIKVKLPIIFHVDNVQAFFITKSITTTVCSKHVDICDIFVTEYIEGGIIKVLY